MSASEQSAPRVLVASAWDELDPGNVLLRRGAEAAIHGAWAGGARAAEVSLAGPAEHPGRARDEDALAGRELVATTVERAARESGSAGAVVVAADGAALAGALVGLARAGVAGVLVPGGPSVTGYFDGAEITAADVVAAAGDGASGEALDRLADSAWPGSGVPPLQSAAGTMACVAEALGVCVPGTAGPPAIHQTRDRFAHRAGELAAAAAARGERLRELLTVESLENATAVVAATGGSPEAVGHLLALAEACGIEFDLARAGTVLARTPRLADLLPHGRFDTVTFSRCGGVGALLALLLERGLVHGEARTVAGTTIAEAYGGLERYDAAAAIVTDPELLAPTLVVEDGELRERGEGTVAPSERAAAAVHRAAFRAMGISAADLAQPLAGVASLWSADSAAGGAALALGEVAEEGAWLAGCTPRRLALHSFDPDAPDPEVALETMAAALERAIAGNGLELLLGIAADELGIAALMLAAVRADVVAAFAVPAGLQGDPESRAMARAAVELGFAEAGAAAETTLAGAEAAAFALGTAAGSRHQRGERAAAGVDADSLARAAAAFGALGAAPDALLPLLAVGTAAGVEVSAAELIGAADAAAPGWSSTSKQRHWRW